MTKIYARRWEIVDADDWYGNYTERLIVPGGWLVRETASNKPVHSLFYSDPEYKWKLKGTSSYREKQGEAKPANEDDGEEKV